jgi:hypothetical protein
MTLEELKAENARLKTEVDRLAECEGYHYTAIAISMLKEQLQQKNIDYVESRKTNEAKVEMIKSLKAEVERLTKAGDDLHAFLINYIVESRISSAYLNKLDDGWLAAKEGNGQS